VAKIKDKTHPAVLALKNYAESKKINRDDLAHKAGVGLVTINRLMSGDIPSAGILQSGRTVGLVVTTSSTPFPSPSSGAT
jgi:hypothetical protein